MSDEYDLATDKALETIEDKRREAAEERAREERGRPRWLDYLAISTALFAVIAAIASLKAGTYANEALFQANKAVLTQTQAVDTWSEFQADSVKKYQQQTLLTILPHVGGTAAEIQQAKGEIARRQTAQNALRAEATRLSRETDERNKDAERQLEFHHRFAASVTLLQVAVGLSAIAALLRLPVVWYASLATGAFAILVFVGGFTAAV
jgi:hypothetical protein